MTLANYGRSAASQAECGYIADEGRAAVLKADLDGKAGHSVRLRGRIERFLDAAKAKGATAMTEKTAGGRGALGPPLRSHSNDARPPFGQCPTSS